MTTHSISLSRRVTASPEQVWGVLTDIPGAAETLSGVRGIEMLSEPPYGVGTRWRETRTMFGKTATEELWVSAADAPSSTVVEAESAGTHYVTTFTVTPEGQASILTMEFSVELVSGSRVHRFFWKAFGKAGLRVVTKTLRVDLDDIAVAAEKAAGPAALL